MPRQYYGNGINAGMYNGGAVVFNPMPFLQFSAQQQAKKAAREDALDKYYAEQLKSVTPTGMRAKDIEGKGGWAEKAAAWKSLAMGPNKKYIVNPALDGYKTLNAFSAAHTELLSLAERSKQAAKDEETIAKAKLEGKMNPTDTDLEVLSDIGKPLHDTTRLGRTLNDLSINRPPFDSNKFLTDVQAGRTRGKVEDMQGALIDSKRGFITIPHRMEYRPEDIKAMADNAPFVMGKDRSALDAFQRILESPEKLAPIQQAYNKFYPGLVDTPEKAAKGYAIMGVAQATGHGSDTKPYEDPNLKFNQQKELIGLRYQYQKRLQDAKSAKDATEQAGVVNNMMNDILQEAKNNAHEITERKNKTGEIVHREINYDIPAFGDIAKAAMTPGEKYAPDALRYIEKGGKGYIRRIQYQRQTVKVGGNDVSQVVMKDGKPVLDVGASQTMIPLKQFRDQLGRTMFSGKIEYGELQTDFKPNMFGDESFDETRFSGGGGGGTAPKAAEAGTGGWKTRATKK